MNVKGSSKSFKLLGFRYFRTISSVEVEGIIVVWLYETSRGLQLSLFERRYEDVSILNMIKNKLGLPNYYRSSFHHVKRNFNVTVHVLVRKGPPNNFVWSMQTLHSDYITSSLI